MSSFVTSVFVRHTKHRVMLFDPDGSNYCHHLEFEIILFEHIDMSYNHAISLPSRKENR